MNKTIKRILIILALLALADGIYYNFLELWLAENDMHIKTISTVFSLCSILTVSTIFLCSNLIGRNKLKRFTNLLFLIKAVVLLLLFFLNESGLNVLIRFLAMLDWCIDTEIIVSIYPLISNIQKDDKSFAIKSLIYDGFYYIGVIIVGFLLGKQIFLLKFTYNSYVLISFIIIIMCGILFSQIDYNIEIEEEDKKVLTKVIKELKYDKISIFYLLFLFFGQISFYTVMGILLTILVKNFNYQPTIASNIKLVSGIIAVLLGYLVLAKLTCKNNYINFTIKFIIRYILYMMAVFIPTKLTVLTAIMYTRLLTNCYINTTDSPYINRFDGNEQLSFSNFREMISYLGRAIGTYLCGVTFVVGITTNLFLASIFCLLQIITGLTALYLYNQERKLV